MMKMLAFAVATVAALGGCASSTSPVSTSSIVLSTARPSTAVATQRSDAPLQGWKDLGLIEGEAVSVHLDRTSGALRKAWVKQTHFHSSIMGPQAGNPSWTTTSVFVVDCDKQTQWMRQVAAHSTSGARVWAIGGDLMAYADRAELSAVIPGSTAAVITQYLCKAA